MSARKISHHLEEWMIVKGVDQTKLEQEAGVSRKTLTRILSGERFFSSTMQRITDYLGIEYEHVFEDPKTIMRLQRAKELAKALAGDQTLTPNIKDVLEDPDAMLDKDTPLTPRVRRALQAVINAWLDTEDENDQQKGVDQ